MDSSCWLLHKHWSGETSAKVTFLTRQNGIVQGLCRGGRLPKKQVLLQPFTPLWVDLYERGRMCYVQKIELSGPVRFLEGQSLLAGLYVNELIYRAMQPNDVCTRLFDAYEMVLQTLEKPLTHAELSGLLRTFEWTLLTEMGYALSLTHEARTGQAIVPEQHYVWIAEEGLVSAPKGLKGEHLLGMAAQEWNTALVRKTAKTLLRMALDDALCGRAIVARALY